MLHPIYIKTSVQYAPISVYTTISMVCNGREKEKMMELGVSTAGTSKELDDILQIYSKQTILCRQLKKKNLSIEQKAATSQCFDTGLSFKSIPDKHSLFKSIDNLFTNIACITKKTITSYHKNKLGMINHSKKG